MSNWHETEEADKQRLWNHILVHAYGTADLGQVKKLPYDPEGHAFFYAISKAYTPCDNMRGSVPVDQELVEYLAGWARDTSQGYDEKGGPLGPHENHFVLRAFNGFIRTLRKAVMLNQLRYFADGQIMYGCFVLPQWLIDKYMDEARESAERDNEDWDEDPDLRYLVRSATL
ncbi:MAG TPA: hypothetical protein VN701_01490 [Candidatus Paceibacterota bacterium]|nr:hypothetical protein [Candidatus Paceibacterota bacterium]